MSALAVQRLHIAPSPHARTGEIVDVPLPMTSVGCTEEDLHEVIVDVAALAQVLSYGRGRFDIAPSPQATAGELALGAPFDALGRLVYVSSAPGGSAERIGVVQCGSTARHI